MLQYRLSNLAIMSIERDLRAKIDFKEIISKFASKKAWSAHVPITWMVFFFGQYCLATLYQYLLEISPNNIDGNVANISYKYPILAHT